MITGNIIKHLRNKKGLTQDELGEVLGIKKSAVQKYESGSITNLKLDTLQTLCEYFSVPPWVFIYSDRIDDLNNLDEIVEFYAHIYDWEQTLKLNKKGQEKMKDYLNDLLKIEEYRKWEEPMVLEL